MKLKTDLDYQFGEDFSYPIQTLEGRIVRKSEPLVPINHFNGKEDIPIVGINRFLEAIVETFEEDQELIRLVPLQQQLDIINTFHFYKSLSFFVRDLQKLEEYIKDLHLYLLGLISLARNQSETLE